MVENERSPIRPRARAPIERVAAISGLAKPAPYGGPSVERVARLLPAPEEEGPPAGIWTA